MAITDMEKIVPEKSEFKLFSKLPFQLNYRHDSMICKL